MWAGGSAVPGGASYGGAGGAMPGMAQQTGGGSNNNQQKNDIFVGNLAFNTTEEQLHQAFSEIGRVLNVRLVTDIETGKPRGFAFVEFQDPQAALSAIRNMNEYELNGRRLRVNFSNSSHLEELAGKLGMDLSQNRPAKPTGAATTPGAPAASAGTSVVADALKGFTKGEAYDVIAKLKEIGERDPDEARRLISGHPQLPEALLYLMSNKLDMVKTPIATNEAVLPSAIPGAGTATPAATSVTPAASTVTRAADPRARMDPRVAAAAAAQPPAAAPPTRVADPRQRMDPRMKQEPNVPPPPQQPPQQPRQPPPPPPRMPPQQPAAGAQGQQPFVNHAPHLDPTLVQQVMSLTPHQIQQLPPDKQQSILQLRRQITGGHGM